MKIYNSLNRELESFEKENKELNIYVCGPDVYDYSHIGHARVYCVFDVIKNYLEQNSYKVKYSVNISDDDNKITRMAEKKNMKTEELAKKMRKEFIKDLKSIKVDIPDFLPNQTDYIQEIIKYVNDLIENGYAYRVNGNVYFDASKIEDFGALIGDKERAIAENSYLVYNLEKRNPEDFFLWKLGIPIEPRWDSPWGLGKAGWHIGCSVMSKETLGNKIDIHGGGADLKFPHHEGERIQSNLFEGKRVVDKWMHVGLVRVDGEKMSKSKNNYIAIKDLIDKWSPYTIRFLLLSVHYRQPLDYNMEDLEKSSKRRDYIQNFYRRMNILSKHSDNGSKDNIDSIVEKYRDVVFENMSNDFYTPGVLDSLEDMIHEIENVDTINSKDAIQILGFLDNVNKFLKIINPLPSQ